MERTKDTTEEICTTDLVELKLNLIQYLKIRNDFDIQKKIIKEVSVTHAQYDNCIVQNR